MTTPLLPLAEVASFMYHEVANDPTRTGFQRPGAREYTLTRRAFTDHLDAIQAGPLVPALVTQANLFVPQKYLMLTFDDGGISALQIGDELTRRGWRAHFFICTGRIGEKTFVDPAGIRALRAQGHCIGTHSHTHPDIFRDLTRRQMLDEWRISRGILEQITGEPCLAGSVPGGDISQTTLEAAAESGLKYLFTSEPWLRPIDVNGCWIMGRYIVKSTMTVDHLRGLIRMRGWKMAQAQRAVKEVARRALGPAYRYYVRSRTAEG